MLDLPGVMHRLAQTRPIFHSEADFQHALAWQIHTEHSDARIRIEYRPFPNERVYIDIWCELNGLSTAIELKYPTKQLHALMGNEQFTLADHDATDISRYDFIKDIVRLERIVERIFDTDTVAIMLTNDASLWTMPEKEIVANDAAFRIHDGTELSGSRAWSARAGAGTTQHRNATLNLRGGYTLTWQDYSNLNERHGQFRFVIVEPKRASPTLS
jgi:hypothetical protein